MTTKTDFDINEFINSLESYAAECRKRCRDTISTYDRLVTFAQFCLQAKQYNENYADVEGWDKPYNKDIVPFLIELIAEEADSLFLAKDVELANQFKAVDWNKFINKTQSTFYVNIMFDDTDENVTRDNWIWADCYIAINLPVELPEEYAKNIHNIDLHEDGSWSNYLKLEKFGNKHDISVGTPEEKRELLEMYRLMNKYLG